jgi:ankyrin repeat protein
MSRKQPKRKQRSGIDVYGRTPLHCAAADGREEQVIQLLAAGANPNARDDDGWSPLHFAAQSVSASITKVLLGAGAKVELRDSFGNTPLWTAVFASRGDGSVIELLRHAAADPYAANLSGVTPLALARNIANYNVAQFFVDLP